MYILFEGIDRVGKSTQIERLKNEMPDLLVTKEPGATPLGQEIREILLHGLSPTPRAELFLFLADRAEHIQKVIIPNKDRLIVSDRGFISGIAYAHIKTGIDIPTLRRLNDLAMQGVYPDKIVFFEIDAQELERRMKSSALDSIEERGIDYLLQVQKSMKSLLKDLEIPYMIVDATKPEEEIFHTILPFIKGNE